MSHPARDWIAAVRGSHERLAALARPLSAEQLASRSYAEEWTVAQVLSHLGSGAEIAALTLTAALAGGAVDRSGYQAIWAAWDAKSPPQQAAGSLAAGEATVARLEGLTDADLGSVSLEVFGRQLDATGLVGMWLAELVLHTWDIEVTLDRAAVLPKVPATLLTAGLPAVASFAARPAGEPLRARLRATDADTDFLLAVAESASLTPWRHGLDQAPAQLTLPSEALVRLCYGRLDPAHTPPGGGTGDDGTLARVRAIFPGF